MRWDPEQYLQFADHRGRPFRDLLARVGAREPRTVVDLGCGPGNLTRELVVRWPRARVEGIDSSAEMIERARAGATDGHAVTGGDGITGGDRVRFSVGDLRTWTPDAPVDVIVSNATLQWVPGHLDLLDRLAGSLAAGGWLAFQVPGNFTEPSHTELAALRDSPRWRERLSPVERPAVEDTAAYLERLAGLGMSVDAWETTYLQVLSGEDAVLAWMRGTGLRPVLSALTDAGERAEFEAEYAGRLRRAYPHRAFGTVLPYRRIFVVAHA